MKSRTCFAASLLAVGASLGCTALNRDLAQTVQTDPNFERVATVIQDAMAEYGVPGVAFGISHRGKRLARGFGVTSVQNPLRVTETTLFQAGSITKTITATAMRLVEAGKVSLDAPIREYLPTFAVEDADASRRGPLFTSADELGSM